MKCEVCDEQIKKNKCGFGRYKHYFYLFHDRSYSLRYGDYSSSIHPHLAVSKDDVMVCHECFDKKEEKITIPTHIPDKQLKDFLISTLKKRRKI